MALSVKPAGPGRLYAALLTAVFFFLVSLAPANAEERTLTLDEARRLAIENHERVAIAGEGVAQARADLRKATSRILPNVTAEGSYTRYTEEKGTDSFIIQPRESTSAELRLTQPLYSGGREWATRRQARLQIQSRVEGVEGASEDIVRETSYHYYGVLKAEKDVEIKSAALRRAEERLEVAEARLRVGDVTRSAVLRAEAERAGAEAELIRSRNGLLNATALLRRVTGLEGVSLKVVEPPRLPAEERSASALVETALGERADYSQRLLEERAAGEGITIARAGFKPSLRLEGLLLWREQEPATTFFQEDSASATLRLTYPLFEGFLRKAELSEARSRLREAELRRLGLRRDIEVQITEALNNIKAIEALTESFRRQLAFAEEDYKMVFEQFRFGVATTLDVIDSENTLVTAQSSLANAVYDLELAKMDLKYLTGTLIEGAAR
ncbi:MAG: TolC family protein [Deltaproteobacteria bacterium]|nr:TolC family protein [Deltaproteobacteria bacterium]MCL4872618.1 TolC family protein [bacterium]